LHGRAAFGMRKKTLAGALALSITGVAYADINKQTLT
jgi:hypothetical protein